MVLVCLYNIECLESFGTPDQFFPLSFKTVLKYLIHVLVQVTQKSESKIVFILDEVKIAITILTLLLVVHIVLTSSILFYFVI